MDVPNYYLVQKVHELRDEELTRRAGRYQHLRATGVDQRSLLAVWACAVLSGLGGLLMTAGRQLKRAAGTPVVSVKRMPRASRA